MSNLLNEGYILIVSSQTSHRAGLRKTFSDLGADNKRIEIAGSFEHAKDRLKAGPPINILVTDDELGKKDLGIDLFDLHKINNTVTRSRIFILMTSQSTPFLMADFTLRGGDTIISKPFKNETLIKAIVNIVAEKNNVSVEEGLVWDVEDALSNNEMDKALEILTTFSDLNSHQANFSKAIIHDAQKEFDLAYEFFTKVLEKKVNFKSLIRILKIGTSSKKYTELLNFVVILLKNFPIHHESLPDMTRVIIANKKFDLLDELFQLLAQHKIEDHFAKIPLAAGFVLAATHHFESDRKDRAIVYALKAIEYSCGRFQILFRALELLVKAGAADKAIEAYIKIPAEDSVEFKIQDLRLKEIIYPRASLAIECQRLIWDKVIDADLYQLTMNCLKAIGKDTEDLYQQAVKHFPDRVFTK